MWRNQNTLVNGRNVLFWTYDDLYDNVLAALATFSHAYRQAQIAAPGP